MQITDLQSSNKIKKEELVRLILQSLTDLGYKNTATTLETESGINLESDIILEFRSSILNGQWQVAEKLLSEIPFIASSNHSQVLFLIKQQNFLELLEQAKVMKALHVLRTEITPLSQNNTDRLHLLSSLVLCTSIEDIMEQASWDGANGSSRSVLLNDIQQFIDPSYMMPSSRLLTLIHQAIEYQQSNCLYHHSNKDTEFSLFSNHLCDKNALPTATIKILRGHTDEIWHVAYSHDGKYLASLSKDKTCVIWDMERYEQIQTFKTQVSGSYCAWSPDDKKLLICGIDYALRLWDPLNGVLLQTYQYHKDQVTSCVWLPDSDHFISGACDKYLCLWNCSTSTHLQPVNKWSVQRTTDMKISENGKRFVTIGLDQCLTVYDVDGLNVTQVCKLPEGNTMTSLALSRDGNFALVNIQDTQEIHLWNIEQRQIVHKYIGQKQNSYIIRSTLGGPNESFILSGSEDNRVYIWSREHETLIEALEGHEKTVNCVSWCPVGPMKFVSVSDDHTIRLWGSF